MEEIHTRSEGAATDQRHRYKLRNRWIEIRLTNGLIEPVANARCLLYLADGSVLDKNLNGAGKLRCDGLPPGHVKVEFPDFFELAEIDEDGRSSWTAGTPPEIDPAYCSAKPEDEEEDESGDEDEDDVLLAYGEEAESAPFDPDLPAEMNDDEDLEDEELDHFDDHEDRLEAGSVEFDVAMQECITGKRYHFGIMQCVSIQLYRRDRVRLKHEPVHFRLTDSDGFLVYEHECDDGLIFIDQLGIDRYRLEVGDRVFTVPSVADATEVMRIILDPPTGAE